MGSTCCKTQKLLYQQISIEEEENVPITTLPILARHHIHDIDTDEKFDSFTLIWLDKTSKENFLDSLRTRTLLREINSNKNCLFYNDPSLFLNDINGHIPLENKILLIVSGSYAEQILSTSSNIQNTVSIIIIFCNNHHRYKKFLGKSNVTDMCTDYDSLKTCILRELPSLKFNLFQNRSFKTIQSLSTKLNSSSIQNYDNIGAYLSYKLFVELLKEIPQTDQAKDNMLKQCKDYYRQNRKELEKIELFRTDYCETKAIDWYTRDSFVYKLVNQAFRTEDTALWYLFRFYIRDLCKQMEVVHKEQQNQKLYRLYRGQPFMPTKEFDNIQTNTGGLISTNGFFSTSQSFNQALQFLKGANDTDDFKVVIFEIILPSNELKNTIFVDVERHLNQMGEQEILFDIGTIFKIENVERNEGEKFWRIKMTATDEGTMEIKQQIDSMKKKFQTGNLNLLLGRLLLDMHQYIKADAYFQMMLQVLPTEHPDLASIHDYIGDLQMRTTNYYSALTHFELAYNLKRKRLSSNHPDLGITFNNMGNYYKAIGDMSKACLYYKKGLKCKNSLINIAITKLNIGITRMMDGCYCEARDWSLQAGDILHQIEPRPHTEIIMYRAVMGDIFFRQQEHDEAEAYYSIAFDLCKKFLSIGDFHRTRCANAFADLYEKQDGNGIRALKFCFEQLSIHEKYLSDKNHVSIAYIQMKIAQLSNDNNYYRKALEIFENNIHQEYATVSDCQMMLASYCQYDEALQLYSLANEIQKKIYPPNHSIILESQQQLIKIKRNKTHLTNLSKQNTLAQNQSTNMDLQQQQESPFEDVSNTHELIQMELVSQELLPDHQSTVEDLMKFHSDECETHLSVSPVNENSTISILNGIEFKSSLYASISEEVVIDRDLTISSQFQLSSTSLDVNHSSQNNTEIFRREIK